MKITTIAALIITSSTAYAGGLSDPIVLRPVERPTVGTAVRDTGWAGGYAGLSYSMRTMTDDIDDIYVRECRFGNAHRELKCATGDHKDSPEIAELERVDAPWTVDGYRRGEIFDTPVLYDEERGIIWGSNGSTFTYTPTRAGDPEYVQGKNAQNVLVDTITEIVQDSAIAGGHIGHRWDIGAIVGVEASTDGTMTTAEVSAGISLGSMLPYAFVGAAQFDVGDFGDVTTEALGARISFNF